jgi:molybdate transport system permease protein
MSGWLGPEEWQAVALSLRVAIWATARQPPVRHPVAYALSRWDFAGQGACSTGLSTCRSSCPRW